MYRKLSSQRIFCCVAKRAGPRLQGDGPQISRFGRVHATSPQAASSSFPSTVIAPGSAL